MSEANGELDADELIHLAVQASERDDSERALVLAKRALAARPDDGPAHFFLGSLYADLGLEARAIEELGRAVELAPSLHTARLHLGLLWLAAGDVQEAREVWAPLEERGEDDPYFRFQRALLHLAEERVSECLADLRAGIARNDSDDALNRRMGAVLESVEQDIAEEEAASASPAGAEEPEAGDAGAEPASVRRHPLLFRYQAGSGEGEDG